MTMSLAREGYEDMDPALALFTRQILEQRAKDDSTGNDSPIQQFYADTTVFISGASGFLGRQLIEKLLRSCPGIKRIYILLRAKKGKNVQNRLAQILESDLYDELRRRQPEFADKIGIMEGDVVELSLGLSEADRRTFAEEVQVILHAAATVRFDTALNVAILTNVRGTREMMALASTCRDLRALVHVSTAFCNYHEPFVKEKFYQVPVPYDTLIRIAETLDAGMIDEMMPALMGKWGINTYVFTKAVSENLVQSMAGSMPVCVVRPTIVVSTYKEPVPGWIDMNAMISASGIVFGACLGVVSVTLIDKHKNSYVLPLDYCNNAIITAAWKTGTDHASGVRHKDPKIYTLSSIRNELTWEKLRFILRYYISYSFSSPYILWYGYTYYFTNCYIYGLISFIYHMIPATIADYIALILGKDLKTRPFVRKLDKMMYLVQHATCYKYKLLDNNYIDLIDNCMDERDKCIFPFDLREMDWKSFMANWITGMRKYIVKDGLQGTKKGARKFFYFLVAHYFIYGALCFLLVYVFMRLFFPEFTM